MAMPILSDADRRKQPSMGFGGNRVVARNDLPPNYDSAIANRPDPAGYQAPFPTSPPSPSDPIQNIITTPIEQVRQGYGSSPNVSQSPGYSQSASDQLRRSQAWRQLQQGRKEANLTPAELQAMQNRVANQMSSASSSAERMATESAARAGTLGGGATDRRLQELAAMNQAGASQQMSAIEADALQRAKDRQLQYAGMGTETASRFGRDEMDYAGMNEQSLMDRMRLQEQGRIADMGNITDLYKFQNMNELLNRYRNQEREEYQPILNDILRMNKPNTFSSTMGGIGGGGGWGRG
jgi:hypothetical protein